MVINGPIFNITAPVNVFLSQFSKEDCPNNDVNNKIRTIFNKYAKKGKLYIRNFKYHERCNKVSKIYGLGYNKYGQADIRADICNTYITQAKGVFSDLLYLYCDENSYIEFLKELLPDINDEDMLAYKLYNEVM